MALRRPLAEVRLKGRTIPSARLPFQDFGCLYLPVRPSVTPKLVLGDWRISHRASRLRSAPSEIIPKASIEPPGASKDRSIAFRKFQPFSQNRELSMAYAQRAAKKNRRPRRWADMGRAPRRRTVLMRENAFRARQPRQLRIPLARLVLVHPDSSPAVDFEAGPSHSSAVACERPAQATRSPFVA
jgi:hypothetical protein